MKTQEETKKLKKIIVYTRFNQFLIDKGFKKDYFIYSKKNEKNEIVQVKGFNLSLIAENKDIILLSQAIKFYKLRFFIEDV